MTASLIKVHDAVSRGLVQSFGEELRGDVNVIAADEAVPLSPEAEEILALRQEISELQDGLVAEKNRHEIEIERVRAETRLLCESEHAKVQTDTISVLKDGMTRLQETFSSELSGLERLSLAISEAALEGIFGGEHDFQQHLHKLVTLQLKGLRRETVIGVRVSSDDFGDEMSLTDLENDAGIPNLKVASDSELQSGEARIELRLGHIEFSLNQQWDDLKRVLTNLAERGGEP
jgi:flagellar biosynthesis/type III secretory pathway protein FliH